MGKEVHDEPVKDRVVVEPIASKPYPPTTPHLVWAPHPLSDLRADTPPFRNLQRRTVAHRQSFISNSLFLGWIAPVCLVSSGVQEATPVASFLFT